MRLLKYIYMFNCSRI